MSEPTKTIIEVSSATIFKIILSILVVVLLFLIRDIVVLFFLVLVIVAALTPLVDRLSKKVPRTLVVACICLLFVGFLVGTGFLLAPPLVSETKLLAINLPIIISKLGPIYHNIQSYMGNYQESLLNLSSQLGDITTGLFSKTIGFVSGVFAFIMIIVLSFYMLVDKDKINDGFYNLLPPAKKEKIILIMKKISDKMGQWLGGHLLLMLIIGILDGVVLGVLGVPYALILAIWGGLVEIIPYLGPWLGLIPAVIIASTISPLTALLVAIAFVVVQQLESTLVAPKIIGKAVGLSPVIIIFSLLAGAKLFGLLGVIIAVPVAAVISVLIAEWPEIKELNR